MREYGEKANCKWCELQIWKKLAYVGAANSPGSAPEETKAATINTSLLCPKLDQPE
jgi:hypothetical protein